jgi:dTMP kinase
MSEAPPHSRGLFIVLEGLDRSGKTSACASLSTALHAVPTRFPNRSTPIGTMINNYLQNNGDMNDASIHLLFSANRWECADSICSILLEGKHIICDRYSYSGIAFSCAKGLKREWCQSMEVGLPEPDLIFFLDISPETAQLRGGYGQERYETEAIQLKVKEQFDAMIEEERKNDAIQPKKWITIDANKSQQEIHEAIRDRIHAHVLTFQIDPINRIQ